MPNTVKNLIFTISLLGGITIVFSTMFGMSEILNTHGFRSLFEVIKLGGELKVSGALYATMAGVTFTISLIGIYLIRKSFTKSISAPKFIAAAFGSLTLLVPKIYGLKFLR